jgi:cytochrome b
VEVLAAEALVAAAVAAATRPGAGLHWEGWMAKVQSKGMTAAGRIEREVRVWDLFVRIFHWTVAIGFFVAYFSEDGPITIHVWAGYAVGALVLLRIVWGFVGPQHARFSDFVWKPGVVLRYLGDLMMLRGHRYLGHSPGGGAMVVALLIGLFVTVGSGLVLYAVEENAGPLAGIVTGASTQESVPAVGEEGQYDEVEERGDERGAGSEELWEEAHEVLANLTLVLVILHVAGVLLASYVHHENLTRAMLTGRKRAPSE